MNHNTQYEIAKIHIELNEQKVSHILHLILSFITCGAWVVVWLLITLSASIEKRRLNGKLKRLMVQASA